MELSTLIIGYVPLTDTTGKKPRELKHDAYVKGLLAQYDLGTVHFASHDDWHSKVDEINPLFIVSLGGDYYAQEVRKYAKQSLLYSADSIGSVFYRKNETEEKKEKHRRILEEIADHVAQARKGGEKEVQNMRHFASLSYKDIYELITRAIISDKEEVKKQAWDLLWGPGEKHSSIIWMRVQMMVEIWQHAKGKQLEKLMLSSMERHLDNGTVRKMDDFTDTDGKKFHQYMFLNLLGHDLNYVRRLPYAKENQERYGYEAMLEKNEIPTNFIRLQLEANEMRDLKEAYLKKLDESKEDG